MDHKYFRDHFVYQIYPRSFCDTNDDGIGDIPGILSKLDYLQRLGVGILWLSPVYKSPNADYGYDISDYRSINPEYGTLADMDELLAEAKKRGIRILMDLVVNHTSSEHPWFLASRDPKSPYREYYFWRPGRKGNALPPNNWTSSFGGSAWTYDEGAQAYYLHLYGVKQPDLDWHSPKVLSEIEAILRFWLNRGVYGFRCDVISEIWKESLADGKKHSRLIGSEHYNLTEGNHQILKKLQEDVFSHYDCLTVGETYDVDFVNARRYADKELDMVFQFDTMEEDEILGLPFLRHKFSPGKFKKSLFAWQWEVDWNANYFENHDQNRSLSRFGDPKKHPKESAKMLATLLFTLRGTPFVYNGEEIGMTDYPLFQPSQYKDPVNLWLYDLLRKKHLSKRLALKAIQAMNRDNARTPMQWDGSVSAGFSSVHSTWLPVNPNYATVNVALEEKDPDSILSYYKKIIALRQSDPILSFGSFEPVKSQAGVMAYFRGYEGHLEFVLANLTGKTQNLPKGIRQLKGEVLLANYLGAGLAYKRSLRPYESLIAKIS